MERVILSQQCLIAPRPSLSALSNYTSAVRSPMQVSMVGGDITALGAVLPESLKR